MGTRCADHATPLYPQKLALTSPTGGGHSVGVVRSRTKATEKIMLCGEIIAFPNKTDNTVNFLDFRRGATKISQEALIR